VLFHFSDLLNKENIRNTSIGYHISPIAVTMAKEKFRNVIQFYCSEEIKLNEKTSVILLVDFLEHLPFPSDFLQSIKKQSKYLLIRLPFEKNIWNIYLKRIPRLRKKIGHFHFYNYRDALNFVQEQELEIIKYNFLIILVIKPIGILLFQS